MWVVKESRHQEKRGGPDWKLKRRICHCILISELVPASVVVFNLKTIPMCTETKF